MNAECILTDARTGGVRTMEFALRIENGTVGAGLVPRKFGQSRKRRFCVPMPEDRLCGGFCRVIAVGPDRAECPRCPWRTGRREHHPDGLRRGSRPRDPSAGASSAYCRSPATAKERSGRRSSTLGRDASCEDARWSDPDRPTSQDVNAEPISSIYLETERLTLRRLTEDDVDNLYELDSDPEVMHYLTGGIPHTREEIVEKVLPHYLDHYEWYEDFGFWAAIEKATGAFIGWFHLRPYHENRSEIELGYRLKRSAWGKHYATEGSRALIEKGFTELGVEKIVADTLVANARSRRVMEALGMHREEEFEADEEEFPTWGEDQRRGVKYALTRAEWESFR